MAVTKETVESRIQEIAQASVHAKVLEGKEAFEIYNAIVGTTFDKVSYEKVAEEAPEYLFDHIPGGSKVIPVKEEDETETVQTTETTQTTDENTGQGTNGQGTNGQSGSDPEPTGGDPEPVAPTHKKSKAKKAQENEEGEDAVQAALEEQEANIGETAPEKLEEFDLDNDNDIDEADLNIAYSQVRASES